MIFTISGKSCADIAQKIIIKFLLIFLIEMNRKIISHGTRVGIHFLKS